MDAEYDGPDCKLGRPEQVATSQRVMSLRREMLQAGYARVSISPTPVQGHDLLRMIPIRKNPGDCNCMRPKGKISLVTKAIRNLSIPVMLPGATVLNFLGYHGVPYYVSANRDP